MKRKKRPMTLIEIMIVMFLITLIAGAIGYNVIGALEKGKAFSTHQNIKKIENVLLLKMSEDSDLWEELEHHPEGWKKYIEESTLIKNSKNVVKDGWGIHFRVSINSETQEIEITSRKFTEYKQKNPNSFKD